MVRNESLRAEGKQIQVVLDMHNLAVTLADIALVSALLYLDSRQAA